MLAGNKSTRLLATGPMTLVNLIVRQSFQIVQFRLYAIKFMVLRNRTESPDMVNLLSNLKVESSDWRFWF